MTSFLLQDDLIEELKSIFKGFLLKKPLLDSQINPKISELNIFSQNLPLHEDDNEEDDPYPYIIVKIDSGNMKGDSAHDVRVRLVIGIFDDNINRNGHKDILNVIQKIYERFSKDPVLAGKYVMKENNENPFSWALQEDDTYPYYFGAIEMTWETRAIRRESKFT